LIKTRHKTVSKIVFIGSSKGGYSALNFAMNYKNAFAVVASPQYLLGNYLNCDIMKEQIIDIVGKVTDEKIEFLNNRLRNIIKERGKKNKPIIYIHYSDSEHTYFEHITFLLDDLKDAGITVFEDVHHYKEHGDLYKYYPRYLVDVVNKLIDDKNFSELK